MNKQFWSQITINIAQVELNRLEELEEALVDNLREYLDDETIDKTLEPLNAEIKAAKLAIKRVQDGGTYE